MHGYHDRGLDRIKSTICTQYRIKKAYQNASCKHLSRVVLAFISDTSAEKT